MSAKKDIKIRLGWTFSFFALCAIAVIAQMFKIQFVDGDNWKKEIASQESTEHQIDCKRGDILAADGEVLSSSIPSYEFYMDTRAGGLTKEIFYNNVDSLALCLSQLIEDKTQAEYKRNLTNAYRSGKRFYKITRQRISYTKYKDAQKFPIFRRGENGGGFIAKRINERKLPFGLLAARTIGNYNPIESKAYTGIENAFHEYLKGTPGCEIRKKISGSVISIEKEPAIPGNNIKTTLDVHIQDIVESALLNQMQTYAPVFGTAIVMDVKTGDIKAVANLGKRGEHYSECYNYAIGQSTEPGSTFKLPSLMVALEDGVVKLTDTINTGNGSKKFHNVTLHDSKRGGHGRITVQEVFEHSSNIGMATIINDNYKNNPDHFIDRLYAMGLSETLNIGIKGEGEADIRYPSDTLWSGISLPWTSIGYEVSLTPLQTLTFYNAVANNGKMMRPRLVTDIMENRESILHFEEEVINPSICSQRTIMQAQDLLEGVVLRGTAKNLKESHLDIAGKTGTARVANDNQGYNRTGGGMNYRASFCGYFPVDSPLYSCIVLVESPSKKGIYGNVVAGTVFREIADKIYAQNYNLQESDNIEEEEMCKVPVSMDGYREELLEVFAQLETPTEDRDVEDQWVRTFNKEEYIEIQSQPLQEHVMPEVRGMGAKDVLFLLENLGLKVTLTGCGRVKKQSIRAGQSIKKGLNVNLNLG